MVVGIEIGLPSESQSEVAPSLGLGLGSLVSPSQFWTLSYVGKKRDTTSLVGFLAHVPHAFTMATLVYSIALVTLSLMLFYLKVGTFLHYD